MKIVGIYFIKTFDPNFRSGTGCSEPDIFLVKCDDGVKREVWIDTWYVPKDEIKDVFRSAIYRYFDNCENINDAYKMYKLAVKFKNR